MDAGGSEVIGGPPQIAPQKRFHASITAVVFLERATQEQLPRVGGG